MKKISFILLFYITPFSVSFSQNPVLDSLELLISKHKKDSLYIDLRIELTTKKISLDPSDSTLFSYNQETLLLSKNMRYPRGVMFSLQRAGIINQYILSEPYKAIDNYYLASKIAASYPHLRKYERDILGNMANIYYSLQDHDMAIKYGRQALQRGVQDSTAAFITIGNSYGQLGVSDSSLLYYDKGLEVARKKQNVFYIAHLLSTKTLILTRMGRLNEAVKCIEEALYLIEKYNIEYSKQMTYSNASVLYLSKKEYKKAEEYAWKAFDDFSSINNLEMKAASWGTLSEVYEKTNRFEKALDAYKKYDLLNDTLSNQALRDDIARKELKYEQDIKDELTKIEQAKKDAFKQAEIDKQKSLNIIYLISSIIIFILILIIFLIYRNRQRAIQLQKNLLLQSKISESELKALRAQMNPHFIFNALNSIADYIHKNDTQSADYYLTKFAKLMRGTLENSEEREVPVKEELKMIELYMQLESDRLNNKFTYEIKIDTGIDVERTLMPSLLLQPFVENSIWHGLANKLGKGKIMITVSKRENNLLITIEDDGIGRVPKEEAKKKSYGTKLTKGRIDIIRSIKNGDASVEINDLEQGTRVEITLPFEEE